MAEVSGNAITLTLDFYGVGESLFLCMCMCVCGFFILINSLMNFILAGPLPEEVGARLADSFY